MAMKRVVCSDYPSLAKLYGNARDCIMAAERFRAGKDSADGAVRL